MTDAVSEHFSTVAAQWVSRYKNRPSFVARLERVGTVVAGLTPPPSRVLDVGAGAGIFSLMASERAAMVIAVDSSPAMLRNGVEHLDAALAIIRDQGWTPRPELVHRANGTLDCIRAQDNSAGFDLILAIAVIEYLREPLDALLQIQSLLRPRGRLLLSVPNQRSLLRVVERPVDIAASWLGRLLRVRRLQERAYDMIRPGRLPAVADLVQASGLRLESQEHLPLGLAGWRRRFQPSTLLTLRKDDPGSHLPVRSAGSE